MTDILKVQRNAEERDELATIYSSMSSEYGALEGQMAELWLEKRALHPDATDKFIDKLVTSSEIGKRYNTLKYTLKGYEKRISSLNSIIQVANAEARGQF